jgi:hypothetical protein
MLSSTVRSYPDADRYETAFVGAKAEVLPTRPGSFAGLCSTAFGSLWRRKAGRV